MDIKTKTFSPKMINRLYELRIFTWDDLKSYGVEKFLNDSGLGRKSRHALLDLAEEEKIPGVSWFGDRELGVVTEHEMPEGYRPAECCFYCKHKSKHNSMTCAESGGRLSTHFVCSKFAQRK